MIQLTPADARICKSIQLTTADARIAESMIQRATADARMIALSHASSHG